MFKIKETKEAKQAKSLTIFPLGYRGIRLGYQGYEIRIKPFSTYNIFYVVDNKSNQITILRVLKDRQNWKTCYINFKPFNGSSPTIFQCLMNLKMKRGMPMIVNR